MFLQAFDIEDDVVSRTNPSSERLVTLESGARFYPYVFGSDVVLV